METENQDDKRQSKFCLENGHQTRVHMCTTELYNKGENYCNTLNPPQSINEATLEKYVSCLSFITDSIMDNLSILCDIITDITGARCCCSWRLSYIRDSLSWYCCHNLSWFMLLSFNDSWIDYVPSISFATRWHTSINLVVVCQCHVSLCSLTADRWHQRVTTSTQQLTKCCVFKLQLSNVFCDICRLSVSCNCRPHHVRHLLYMLDFLMGLPVNIVIFLQYKQKTLGWKLS